MPGWIPTFVRNADNPPGAGRHTISAIKAFSLTRYIIMERIN
jgi:hypothetical protein